ncbi:hypothetical protein ACROYT_G015385 [Oculina patagonica]
MFLKPAQLAKGTQEECKDKLFDLENKIKAFTPVSKYGQKTSKTSKAQSKTEEPEVALLGEYMVYFNLTYHVQRMGTGDYGHITIEHASMLLRKFPEFKGVYKSRKIMQLKISKRRGEDLKHTESYKTRKEAKPSLVMPTLDWTSKRLKRTILLACHEHRTNNKLLSTTRSIFKKSMLD